MWCNFTQSKEGEQTWRIAPLPPRKWILLLIFHLQLSHSVGWSHPRRTNNISVTSQYCKSSAAQKHFICLIKVQRFFYNERKLWVWSRLCLFSLISSSCLMLLLFLQNFIIDSDQFFFLLHLSGTLWILQTQWSGCSLFIQISLLSFFISNVQRLTEMAIWSHLRSASIRSRVT